MNSSIINTTGYICEIRLCELGNICISERCISTKSYVLAAIYLNANEYVEFSCKKSCGGQTPEVSLEKLT